MTHVEPSFLLVEPNDILRSGLSCALAEQRSVQRITEATDSARALAAAQRERFSIAILGAGIPEIARYEILDLIAVHTACILILGDTSWPALERATKSRAMGVLCMECPPRELWAAVESIHRGNRFICRPLQQRLYTSLRVGSTPDSPSIHSLTQRERTILRRIGAGDSNREIAAELGLSRRTVDTHRTRLMRKLGVLQPDQLALVEQAVRGWLGI